MIAASLNSRSHLAVIPIAVLNTGAAPLLRFALPGGSVPNNQVKSRVGPIVARSRALVRVRQHQDGDFLMTADFETEMIEVDVVDASPAVLTAISRVTDSEDLVKGFKAFGVDNGDGVASLSVWPYLQHLLDLSLADLASRPGSPIGNPISNSTPEPLGINRP